tara:strand:- start:3840 stop:5027 length:1188 start_codon:yes stop_codon:yes gene_type:complete
MKIAVVGEQSRKSGGNYHQSLKTYKILSNIKKFKFVFLAINSKNKKNEIDEDLINYKTNFIDQLFFLFYSSKIFKSLLKKFKIQNKFEKFIKKREIDFIVFLGCSRLSSFCDKINYATYIYEFHHLFRPDLPEYKGWSDFDFREDLLKTNVKKSLSLIVDTQKKAEDLIKYYNCYEKKINIIPLSPNISALEKDSQELCSKNIDNYISKNNEYFFYPAQYWPHKNHYYILSAVQSLNSRYNKLAKFVFTGYKKNNFQYLNEKAKEFNLTNQITFLEYLSDEDIKVLYKNCKALIMPSLVGYSSLPLYESFYFEKPVFYSKDLLDTSLQKFVNEIDLKDPNNLSDEINNFDKNINRINGKVKIAKQYFAENLSDEKITSKYLSFFDKISYQTKLYK